MDAYSTSMKLSNKQYNDSIADLKTLIEATLKAKAATCTKVSEAVTKSFTDLDYTVAHDAVKCEDSTIFGAAVNK